MQSRLLKECIQLISQTACGLTLIFDLICVIFPTICLLRIALNLQSLLRMLNLRRFSLLFLLPIPLHLVFPLFPFASFSSTTFQFPYAHSSSLPRRFLLVLFSPVCNLSFHTHSSFCLFPFFRALNFFFFFFVS